MVVALGWDEIEWTAEQLEELCQYVPDTAPVRDRLAEPVPITTDLVISYGPSTPGASRYPLFATSTYSFVWSSSDSA